jgi:hypothetical protein
MATTTRRNRSRRSATGTWHAITGTRDNRVTDGGQRCECTGQCGREHRREPDGHCHAYDSPAHRLVVAPAAPGLPWTAAARLPSDALRVWCPACLTDAERTARRHAAAEHVDEQSDLFDPTGGWCARASTSAGTPRTPRTRPAPR